MLGTVGEEQVVELDNLYSLLRISDGFEIIIVAVGLYVIAAMLGLRVRTPKAELPPPPRKLSLALRIQWILGDLAVQAGILILLFGLSGFLGERVYERSLEALFARDSETVSAKVLKPLEDRRGNDYALIKCEGGESLSVWGSFTVGDTITVHRLKQSHSTVRAGDEGPVYSSRRYSRPGPESTVGSILIMLTGLVTLLVSLFSQFTSYDLLGTGERATLTIAGQEAKFKDSIGAIQTSPWKLPLGKSATIVYESDRPSVYRIFPPTRKSGQTLGASPLFFLLSLVNPIALVVLIGLGIYIHFYLVI